MIIHGNKQISGIIYSREASDGGGAVALTNIIRGPQVVFGGLEPDVSSWLRAATKAAILAAFGQTDGKAVIKATNRYLTQLAASGQAGKDKATALAGFINQHPLDAALYGGLYVQDGLVFQMDRAYECTAAKWTDFIGGVEFNGTNVQIVDDVPYFNESASMASASTVFSNSANSTIEAVFKREKTTICVILSGGAANDGNLQLLLNRQGTYHFRNVTQYSAFVDGASTDLLTVSLNADRGYQNKVTLARQTNSSADTTVQSYSMIGSRAAGSSLPFKGYLYGIRIYNRLLTEAEILANQDIDLKRFTPSTP